MYMFQVCTHWLKGHCAFGDKCRYDHAHPEWAPRVEHTNPGYIPPPVEKPEADNLSELPPISELRLCGAARFIPPRFARPADASGPSSSESAADVVQINQKSISTPPVDLPSDPFGAGEGESTSTEHDAAISALSLEEVVGLPDDLDLGSDALETTKLKVDPELLAATEQEERWRAAAAVSNDITDGITTTADATRYYGSMGLDSQDAYDTTGLYGSGTADEALGGYYEEGVYQDEGEYHEGDLAYDEQQYLPGHGTAYESGGAHSSGGEYGGFGSEGTSPGMAAAPWHVPSGTGSDGGWGVGVDPSRYYASSELQSLCWEYYNHGVCSQGEECHMAHGEWCDTCSHYALHPSDSAAREAHTSECRARHDRLEAIRRSAHVECGICMEKVSEKPPPADRRFGLLNCDHPFCLSCIRSWRQQYSGGADVEQALRTCPICREPTHFITPSTVWPSTPEEKESIVAGYKAKLAEIDCRHFNYGDGSCPFGTSCMYRHAYKDGRLEEAAPRRVAAGDEGEIHVVQPVRLSDFIVIQRGRVRGRRR